jgi:uncharacterized membrane protein
MPSQNTELRIQAALRSFSGPLPPPEALERYNQILPGAAERIVVMAESQHSHRLELEKHVITSNVAAQKLGTILGFVVAMTVVVGGIWLVHEGKSVAGLTAVITALASLVGVFLYSKREQQRELARKTAALADAAVPR